MDPSEAANSSPEQNKFTIATKQGIIDQDAVEEYRSAHYTAVRNKGLNGDKPGESLENQPIINSISSNQSQEYFAIATESGFEIL